MNLKGGLGNQLFQYAFYLNLLNHGVQIDGFYESFHADTYERNVEINKLLKKPINITSNIDPNSIKIQCDDLCQILKYLDGVDNGTYLIDGYFQNLEYVVNSKIENHLNFFISQIDKTAIHVRRNDYGHHGLLQKSYYEAALEKLNYPDFYVYSDEYNFSNYVFSSFKGFKGVFKSSPSTTCSDFLNLVSFKNIIIANSTYSWFAAYFGSSILSSKVFYPSHWSLLGNEFPGSKSDWLGIDTLLASF